MSRLFYKGSELLCLQQLVRKYGLDQNSMIMRNVREKRTAWSRLSKEFNSVKANSHKTEAQLRKWWVKENGRKKIVARSNTMTSHTECESMNFESKIPFAVIEDAKDPLEANDVKPKDDFDSIPDETLADVLEALPPELVQEQMALALNIKNEPPQSSPPSPSFGENILGFEMVTQDLQRIDTNRIEEREEELHRLQVMEKMWLIKAAKEAYWKSRLERESAEELLLFRKAKRALAERTMNKD